MDKRKRYSPGVWERRVLPGKALHDERVEEEKAGKVRWLRPDYQIPRFGKDLPGGGELALESKPKLAKGAKVELITKHLDFLTHLGEARTHGTERYVAP